MIRYDGITRARLNCNGKGVATTLCVSPNISEVILGIDWLTKPGNVWDFGEKRIKIGDGEWMYLIVVYKVLYHTILHQLYLFL